MAELDVTVGSDSTHSEFEEVASPVIDANNSSDGEIIDSDWHYELETVLKEDFVDQSMLKNVCKCRNIPDKFRPQVWKICLNVANRGNAMSSWDGSFDASTEKEMKSDCSKLVNFVSESNANALESKQKILDDSMAVFTFYCKCRAVKYNSDNGWVDIIRPLLKLELERGDLYNCFYALQSRFIPRKDLSPQVTAAPFHLLRLLLLYHDPELCNFLDTCKIATESFAEKWFSTLFSSHCSTEVVSAIWDIYLQQADSFFVFFLALVILVNAKEQVMSNVGSSFDREETIKTLASSPSVLSIDDVDDFCQLALYYCDRTPSSFRHELAGCFYNGAMLTTPSKLDFISNDLAQSFCLKVRIPELLLSSQPSPSDQEEYDESAPKIRFFVVDCRSAEFYNKGHLLTAFHLDSSLMLSEPAEFDGALQALFAAQEQATQAGSAAAGEHLCFIGSGTEDDDGCMHMVVANLLQKHQAYVSMARGGFDSLMDYLTEVGIDVSEWIVGAERAQPSSIDQPDGSHRLNGDPTPSRPGMGKLKKFAGNMWEKTKRLKEHVVKVMEVGDEEDEDIVRPSTSRSKGDSVFSIGDETEHSDDELSGVSHDDIDTLSHWTAKPGVQHCFECQAVTPDAKLVPAYLLVTSEHMTCLVEVKGRQRNSRQTWVRVKSNHLLCTVIKITSRRSLPELITFKFGELSELDNDDVKAVDADRFIISNAGDATRLIKQLVVQADEQRRKLAGEVKQPDVETS